MRTIAFGVVAGAIAASSAVHRIDDRVTPRTLGQVRRGWDRIAPKNGKIVVPSELNACAKVRRLCAVCGWPEQADQRVGDDLDEHDAGREHEQGEQEQRRRSPFCDAGMNNRQPTIIVTSPATAPRI